MKVIFFQFLKCYLVLTIIVCCFSHDAKATNYTWNGTTTDWATASNWTPNGVPTTGDNVTINGGGTANLVLDQNRTVANFAFSVKTLDLNGDTLTITGTTTCTSGSINNGLFKVNSTSGTAIIAGLTFGANVSFTSYNLYLNGATYNGTAYFEKTSTSSISSSGGNVFNSTTELKNSGATGAWYTANPNPDIYNGNVTFTNLSDNLLQVAYNSSGNQFNGNISLNNTGSGIIKFCEGSASANATLASGKTLNVGTSGVTAGYIYLYRFTQLGTTSQSLTFTGTATLSLRYGTIFNGNVNFITPNIYLNGVRCNGTANFNKTGGSNNVSSGGNVFNDTLEFVQSGSGFCYMANSIADTCNGNVIMSNTSTGNLHFAYNTPSNLFNGNIYFNNTSTGKIYLCSSPTASATLTSGRTLNVGISGVTSGEVIINRFTQLDTTSQSLTFTNTSLLNIGSGTVFNGNFTSVSPRVVINGGTFYGKANITKNGATNDTWTGGTFKSDATITVSGAGFILMASGASDVFDFEGNVTFIRTGSTSLSIARFGTTNFYKNLTYNVSIGTPNTIGSNGGLVCFKGGYSQIISSNTSNLNFNKILINKSSNHVTLNKNVTLTTSTSINPELTLTKGNLITTSSAILKMLDNGTVNGGSDSSFVDGPVKKEGNDAFTFPLGDGGKYMPITMMAPSSTTDNIQAEAYNTVPPSAGNITSPLSQISNCQYWSITSISGTPSLQFTLPWDASTCTPVNPSYVNVARYNGSQWVNMGSNSLVNTPPTGSITSNATTTYGYLTFSTTQSDVTFTTVKKEIDGLAYLVSDDLLRFRFTEEYDVSTVKDLDYVIYDRTHTAVSGHPISNNVVKHGDNRYSINVSSLNSGEYYTLEVENEKNEKWYLRFKVD